MSRNATSNFDDAWAVACELGRFRASDLMLRVGIGTTSANHFIRHWLRDGLIVIAETNAQGRVLSVVNPAEPGNQAAFRETPCGNIWRSMRMLREFSALDLAAHSTTPNVSVSADDAERFCQPLLRAGYLRVIKKPGARLGGGGAVYRLIRNTGPLPPKEQRVRAIYDENLDQFVVARGAK